MVKWLKLWRRLAANFISTGEISALQISQNHDNNDWHYFNSYLYFLLVILIKALYSETKKVTIVGDIHGSLADLFFALSDFENIDKNVYIFNGDFVDRGENGTEVIILLFVLTLVYPKNIYLNRGNHEDVLINVR